MLPPPFYLFEAGPLAAPAAPFWPTTEDIIAKLTTILNVDGVTAAVTGDLEPIRLAVIEEFQSPVADGGAAGGTGRLFTPTYGTKYYDGTGTPSLRVDDIVADAGVQQPPDMIVSAFGTPLADVMLDDEAHHGLGRNVLVRRQSMGTFIGIASAPWGSFPRGKQNISVSATWGFAATLPKDVWEAIRCEVSHRAIRQGVVSLTGVGEIVNAGSFSINTASGISVWAQSSPIPMLHEVYDRCVRRYRDRGHWRRQRLLTLRRMA